MYPIVIFDALRVKIHDADRRMVKNKAVYMALGVSRDGVRKVLGLWIADNEGAKFWLSVMSELKNRGVQDILIAVVDGPKGFPDAITAAFAIKIGLNDFALLGLAVTTVLLGHGVLLIRTTTRSISSTQTVQLKGRTPQVGQFCTLIHMLKDRRQPCTRITLKS